MTQVRDYLPISVSLGKIHWSAQSPSCHSVPHDRPLHKFQWAEYHLTTVVISNRNQKHTAITENKGHLDLGENPLKLGATH